MKKTWLLFLLVAVLLVGCAQNPPATSSVDATSSAEAVSSEEAPVSSEETSSEPAGPSFPVQTEATFEHEGVTYFNVTVAAKGQPASGNDDAFFPEDAEGYYIEKGVYQVSADVFDRIVKKPFLGDGVLKFNKWKNANYTTGDTHVFDGLLPISKINDPLYLSMCQPNEQASPRGGRETGIVNADTLVNPKPGHTNIIPLGAIYLNPDIEIPDDTTFTLCFSSMKCALKFTDTEWYLVNDLEKPSDVDNFYPIPWQLENDPNPVKARQLSGDAVKKVDDHWEITFKASDFRRQPGDDERVERYVYHFWGSIYNFPDGKDGEDLEGVACSYTVWVKDPKQANLLTCDIGADIRGQGVATGQVFAGINFAVTGEPRVIYGHDVCPDCYDKVMDSEKVQQLLGMK